MLIVSDGVMGSRIIQIIPGPPGMEPVTDHDELVTAQPVRMDELMDSVNETAFNTAMITDNLAVITTNVREGRGTLGKFLMDKHNGWKCQPGHGKY